MTAVLTAVQNAKTKRVQKGLLSSGRGFYNA